MTEYEFLLVGIAAVVCVYVACTIGLGYLCFPGSRFYRMYRLHRDTYGYERMAALRSAWHIWKPWP